MGLVISSERFFKLVVTDSFNLDMLREERSTLKVTRVTTREAQRIFDIYTSTKNSKLVCFFRHWLNHKIAVIVFGRCKDTKEKPRLDIGDEVIVIQSEKRIRDIRSMSELTEARKHQLVKIYHIRIEGV